MAVNGATPGNVLTAKTIQITPFRTLVTALKDILTETNIVFQPDGIRIVNMDKSHTILVHMHLEADKFEMYECKKEKIVVGVTMLHLYKLIHHIDPSDTMTMYIEESDYSDGIVTHLGFKFENIGRCKKKKLNLIDPDHEEIHIPDVTFSSIISFPSSNFQKIIRELDDISDKLELCSVGKELIFRCSGHYMSTDLHHMEVDDEGASGSSMSFVRKQDPSKVVQGVFSLNMLGYFVKCTNLCNQIEIYLDNDRPLVVKYDVSSLGTIRMALVPLPN